MTHLPVPVPSKPLLRVKSHLGHWLWTGGAVVQANCKLRLEETGPWSHIKADLV